MKPKSVKNIIRDFQNEDDLLSLAMFLRPEKQHENTRIALKEYFKINPQRVRKIYEQMTKTHPTLNQKSFKEILER